MKILVVEDTEVSRILLQESLLIKGFDVFSACDGIDALQILHSIEIDLIISDIMMPKMDGFELCRIIKRDPKLFQIPFVFYTATYNHTDDENLAMMVGADRFIIKPQLPGKVFEIIEEVWAESQSKDKKTEPVRIENKTLDAMHIKVLNRKLSEKISELEKQQQQLRLLTDALPVLISEIGSDSCYRYVNKAYEDWYGLGSDKIIGLSVRELIGQNGYQIIEPYLTKALQGERVRYEGKLPFSDGEEKYIQAVYIPIKYNGDKSNGCYALVSDVSREKEQEQQLRRMTKMDALGKLTGGIAHDYNNMLAVISGYADLLEENLTDDERLQAYVKQIQKAGSRGAKLTEKLLGFSRHKPVEEQITDINQQFADLQQMLEKSLTVNIQLSARLQTDLWSVHIDQGDLEDAIVNLCINAMHAMPDGGRLMFSTENVTLSEKELAANNLQQSEFVKLVIADNGVGMGEDVLSRIYDPFFTTKGTEGTGLGMSQVYGFISRTGGMITADSKPGQGSSFSMYIPRYKAEEPYSAAELAAIETAKRGGSESILVVEDEPAMRELISEILSSNGYYVLSSATAKGALVLLEKETVGLVISDVIMPGMNGFELAKIISEEYPEVKVQLMSGFSDVRDNSHIDPALLSGLLHKPFSADSLLAKIREQLDKA